MCGVEYDCMDVFGCVEGGRERVGREEGEMSESGI